MHRKDGSDTRRPHALAQPSDAPTLGIRERLLGSLRRAGALAPDALAAGKALGEVTGVGHLGLLPTLLSGFFGVCSPAGARAAEAQLLLLARELDVVPRATRQAYFAREGALQLLRDFIGESARAEDDAANARLRRVLVMGASEQASLTLARRLFGLATRLSTREVALLGTVVQQTGPAEQTQERVDSITLASREAVAGEDRARSMALSLELLICEGLVRALGDAKGEAAQSTHVATELGRQLWSWLGDAPRRSLPRELA